MPFVEKKDPTPNEALLKTCLEVMVAGGAFFWAYIAMICFIVMDDSSESRFNANSIVGSLGCACGLCYYASPLSTMMTVIRTRDSSSLYLPLILTNLVNALMWVFYGFFGVYDVVSTFSTLIEKISTLSHHCCVIHTYYDSEDVLFL